MVAAYNNQLKNSMSYAANDTLEQWLAQKNPEAVLAPELPIIDPHHHLWDTRLFTIQPHASFAQKMYLCEEIVNDIRESGHETEFVQGIVAMSNSGSYGDLRLCAGTFDSADLRAGAWVEEVFVKPTTTKTSSYNSSWRSWFTTRHRHGRSTRITEVPSDP
jgi:hypothetical protein